MEKYTLIFEIKLIDYNDPYNDMVKNIKFSPKLSKTLETKIEINQKPNKELINFFQDKFKTLNEENIEIISCRYLRTEFSMED